MRQWYCAIGSQQYGPVADDVLRNWVAEGRVRPQDLVWTEGMAQWLPLAQAIPEAVVAMTGGGGTGGRSTGGELTAAARAALAGRWWPAVGFCFLILAINSAVGFVPFGNIAGLLIAGPFALGQAIFFLAITRRGDANLGMMFDGFKQFGRALGAYLLMVLFVLLWSLLLIVPGIIAAYSYSMTWYIMADNPQLGIMDSIRRSKEMMRGHKFRLFIFSLRFFGWALLCILTLFIGYLFLVPYIQASYARFYQDLLPPPGQAQGADVGGPLVPATVA